MNRLKNMVMHSGALKSAFEDELEGTPVDDWGYCLFNQDGEYFQVETNAVFFSEFIDNKLYLNIPVSESNLPKYKIYNFRVDFDPNLSEDIKKLAKKHHYVNIANVIKSDGNNTEVFTFASKSSDMTNINYIINHQELIDNLITKIRKRVKPLINKYNCITLPKEIINKIKSANQEALGKANNLYFEHEKKSLQNMLSTTLRDEKNIQSSDFDLDSLPFELKLNTGFSQRQKDMIYLLYHGFSTTEAAEILEVSKRTIERQFKKLREQLNCLNNAQIIKQLIIRSPKV